MDRNRAVTVTAPVDPSVTSACDVVADLNARVSPGMLASYPGVFMNCQLESDREGGSLEFRPRRAPRPGEAGTSARTVMRSSPDARLAVAAVGRRSTAAEPRPAERGGVKMAVSWRVGG